MVLKLKSAGLEAARKSGDARCSSLMNVKPREKKVKREKVVDTVSPMKPSPGLIDCMRQYREFQEAKRNPNDDVKASNSWMIDMAQKRPLLLNDNENGAAAGFYDEHPGDKGCSVRIKVDNKSGIGMSVWIRCKKCRVERDITDYGCW